MVAEFATSQTFTGDELTTQHGPTSITMDGMALVQEKVVDKSQIKIYKRSWMALFKELTVNG